MENLPFFVLNCGIYDNLFHFKVRYCNQLEFTTVCVYKFLLFCTDDHDPVISDCPPPPENRQFNESQKVTWTTPTVTDNSGRYTLVQTAGPQQDNEFTVGVTTITYVASDPSGNNDTCSFNITVTGN